VTADRRRLAFAALRAVRSMPLTGLCVRAFFSQRYSDSEATDASRCRIVAPPRLRRRSSSRQAIRCARVTTRNSSGRRMPAKRKILHRGHIGATGFRVTEVGEPFDPGRRLDEVLELGGGQQSVTAGDLGWKWAVLQLSRPIRAHAREADDGGKTKVSPGRGGDIAGESKNPRPRLARNVWTSRYHTLGFRLSRISASRVTGPPSGPLYSSCCWSPCFFGAILPISHLRASICSRRCSIISASVVSIVELSPSPQGAGAVGIDVDIRTAAHMPGITADIPVAGRAVEGMA
jgi:hypothetical protein